MEKFIQHTGKTVIVDRVNVDTDAIIPKNFLKRVERTGFGQFLFYEWRFLENGEMNPKFEMNKPRYKDASILVSRANFGCGSSREHAPWAILDYGLKVVIAPSFADIFYNNCFKNGLLPIKLTEEQVEEIFQRTAANEGYELYINLEEKVVKDSKGLQIHFDIEEHRRQYLLQGLDDIGLTLQLDDKIKNYELKHAERLAY